MPTGNRSPLMSEMTRCMTTDALYAILEGTAATTGQDFFRSLVRHFASALEVRYAFLAECTDTTNTRVRTLAFWMGKDFGENFEYALADTPCVQVIGGDICYHPSRLRSLFPNDQDLFKLGAESYLGLPITDSTGRVIGHLAAMHDQPLGDPARSLAILKIFAARAGAEMERERVQAQLQRRLQESQALVAINQALNQTLNLERIVQMIAASAQTIIPNVERAVIHALDERDNMLWPVAVTGLGEQSQPRLTMRPGEEIAELVMAEGRVINAGDTQVDPRFQSLGASSLMRSLLVAPVQSGPHRLGAISVMSRTPYAFSPDDEQLLKVLGTQAAIAIENARLYADLKKALHQEKATRARLVQSEKLAAMGRLMASVAHELNNPLQTIQNALYLLQQASPPARASAANMQIVMEETERMAELINRLRETYRPATREEFQPQSLSHIIEELHKLIAAHLQRREIAFEFTPRHCFPPVLGLRSQLKQAVLNLSLNAIDAMSPGGRLSLIINYRPEQDEIQLTIADTGAGIDPDVLPSIFDPFYTTKENGTGLGLAITYDIIQQHGGRIEAESTPGQGTTFRIWLPTAKAKKTVELC